MKTVNLKSTHLHTHIHWYGQYVFNERLKLDRNVTQVEKFAYYKGLEHITYDKRNQVPEHLFNPHDDVFK